MDFNIIEKASTAMYSYIRKYQMDNLSGASLESITKIEMDVKEYSNTLLFADRKRIGFSRRVEGAVFEDEENIFVCFMATNKWYDWLTNFTFFKKALPSVSNKKIRAHSGYLNRYILNSVRSKILVKVSRSEKKKVIVTGYSMGGGLAPICALDLAMVFKDYDVKCVAMAGPRVGNKGFVEKFDKKVDGLNLTFGNDVITKAPPVWWGFRHIFTWHFGPESKWYKFSIENHMPHNLFWAIKEIKYTIEN